MNQYSVVIIDADSKILVHRVEARSAMHSFYVLAQTLDFSFDVIMSMPWQDFDNSKDKEFPGSAMVSQQTILEQANVFDAEGGKHWIVHTTYDNCPLYWNNRDGWGYKHYATVFNDVEKAEFQMPQNGQEPSEWVEHESNE